MKKNPKSIHKHLGVWAGITRIMFDTTILSICNHKIMFFQKCFLGKVVAQQIKEEL